MCDDYDASTDSSTEDHPWAGSGYDVETIEHPDGSTVYVVDTDHDGVPNAVGHDTDGDGDLEDVVSDSDRDGDLDTLTVDTDDDGRVDKRYSLT